MISGDQWLVLLQMIHTWGVAPGAMSYAADKYTHQTSQ